MPHAPLRVCAEGSLVDRSRHFRPMLEELLNEYAAGRLGKHAVLRVSRETTLQAPPPRRC